MLLGGRKLDNDCRDVDIWQRLYDGGGGSSSSRLRCAGGAEDSDGGADSFMDCL